MRRLCVLLAVLSTIQFAGAVSDIGFSTEDGGGWAYTAGTNSGEGFFSFSQPITVDDVLGGTTDALVGARLYIPDLFVSNLVLVGSSPYVGDVYQGVVSPQPSTVVLQDGQGNNILTGTLASGGILTVGTTASMYSGFAIDIIITGLPNAVNSAFINTLQVGQGIDFALTLQDGSQQPGLAANILQNQSIPWGGTLSGDMMVPEPATLALFGMGLLSLIRRSR